ncbi:helix-turn-helix transcriptional regulator [Treponema sp. OMZ 840]|uniref:helix-turn-helix domain-containing protein n=1 Tax=Treponema sp. OMZ 840 TaxID=244313 RepID=UPI003D939AF9
MINKILASEVIDSDREVHYSFRTAIDIKSYPQVHDFYEFSLVLSGGFIMEQKNHVYELEQGDLILTKPGTIHKKKYLSGQTPVHINLAFLKSVMNSAINYLYDKNDEEYFSSNTVLFHLNDNYLDLIKREMQRLSSYVTENAEAEKHHMRWLLTELLHYIINPKVGQELKRTDFPLWLDTLLNRLDSPNSINEQMSVIIKETGLSKEHVIRSFKKHLGTTPTTYHNIHRLNLAAHMLSYTDKEISTISEDLNFNSISYFYKQFKKAFSMTPRQYRMKKKISE